jgi:hypothetical protein
MCCSHGPSSSSATLHYLCSQATRLPACCFSFLQQLFQNSPSVLSLFPLFFPSQSCSWDNMEQISAILSLSGTAFRFGDMYIWILKLWKVMRWPRHVARMGVIRKAYDQSNSVNIVTRLRVGRPGFSSRQGQWWDFFSSPPRLDRLWRRPSLLSNWNWGFLPRG